MTKRDLELEVARLRGQVDVLTEALRHAQQQPAFIHLYRPDPPWWTAPAPQPYITWSDVSTGAPLVTNAPFITSDGHQATHTGGKTWM